VTNEKILKKAPEFELSDHNGVIHRLSDYRGKMVLLYFYPKDMTPGCMVEAIEFQKVGKELEKLGVRLLGVSADSAVSHQKFCKKNSLDFPLLVDEDRKIADRYGVLVEKSMFGKKYMGVRRDSFLIGKDGTILKHYKKVKPATHPGDVLADVKDFASEF